MIMIITIIIIIIYHLYVYYSLSPSLSLYIYIYIYIYICYIHIHIHIYIYIYSVEAGQVVRPGRGSSRGDAAHLQDGDPRDSYSVAIFYPFSQFCEIGIFPPSPNKQPNTAPNLFQRGVEYGKVVIGPADCNHCSCNHNLFPDLCLS